MLGSAPTFALAAVRGGSVSSNAWPSADTYSPAPTFVTFSCSGLPASCSERSSEALPGFCTVPSPEMSMGCDSTAPTWPPRASLAAVASPFTLRATW